MWRFPILAPFLGRDGLEVAAAMRDGSYYREESSSDARDLIPYEPADLGGGE